MGELAAIVFGTWHWPGVELDPTNAAWLKKGFGFEGAQPALMPSEKRQLAEQLAQERAAPQR